MKRSTPLAQHRGATENMSDEDFDRTGTRSPRRANRMKTLQARSPEDETGSSGSQ